MSVLKSTSATKAEVVSLHTNFPRIMVKYISSEDGETASIALPEVVTTRLHAADIEPKDW
jgi:hypothetical protein